MDFHVNKRRFFRLQYVVIVGIAVLFPCVFRGATEARKTAANRIVDWLPDGAEKEKFFDFLRIFPEGELLMISWKGCQWDDPLLGKIAQRLLENPEENTPPFFARVLTTGEMLKSLREPPLELTQAEAMKRLRGWLIGRNGEGCLVAVISNTGSEHRTETIDYVYRVLGESLALSNEDVFVAGPTIDSVAIDEISQTSQKQLLPFFLLFCFTLLLLSLRSFFAASIVFFIALLNEELGPALVIATGNHTDSISMLIGSLVYVLTISAGVHLTNYYRDAIQESSPQDAAWQTIKKAILPCSLAMLTTVLGLCSLAASKMIPIRNFGIFASLALAIGTTLLFLLFFVLVRRFPITRWQHDPSIPIHSTVHGKLLLFWTRISEFVCAHRVSICILIVLLFTITACGLLFLKTTVTFHGMFSPDAKVIRDYDRLEKTIGGLIPLEIVLTIPTASENRDDTILDQLYLLKSLDRNVGNVEPIDSVVSAINFCPEFYSRESSSTRAAAWRGGVRKILPRYLHQFEANKLLAIIENPEKKQTDFLWRLSLRIPAASKVNYRKLLARLDEVIQETLHHEPKQEFPGISYVVTGGVPLAHRAQEQLLKDLINSFLGAFVLIAVTLIFLIMPRKIDPRQRKDHPMFAWGIAFLRSIVPGLLMMIPNLFPCVVAFGYMGWIGKPIDMGTMMTASVAIGISVDGTLHFMTWFYDGMRFGMNRNAAITHSYRQCAIALTQTTIICGCGMLVFSLSGFVPISQFAIFLCILLWLSLLGDLVVFPAILSSPLGALFERKKR